MGQYGSDAIVWSITSENEGSKCNKSGLLWPAEMPCPAPHPKPISCSCLAMEARFGRNFPKYVKILRKCVTSFGVGASWITWTFSAIGGWPFSSSMWPRYSIRGCMNLDFSRFRCSPASFSLCCTASRFWRCSSVVRPVTRMASM